MMGEECELREGNRPLTLNDIPLIAEILAKRVEESLRPNDKRKGSIDLKGFDNAVSSYIIRKGAVSWSIYRSDPELSKYQFQNQPFHRRMTELSGINNWKIDKVKSETYYHRPNFDLNQLVTPDRFNKATKSNDPMLMDCLTNEIMNADGNNVNILELLREKFKGRSERWMSQVVEEYKHNWRNRSKTGKMAKIGTDGYDTFWLIEEGHIE